MDICQYTTLSKLVKPQGIGKVQTRQIKKFENQGSQKMISIKFTELVDKKVSLFDVKEFGTWLMSRTYVNDSGRCISIPFNFNITPRIP